jgi:hypothetical protein
MSFASVCVCKTVQYLKLDILEPARWITMVERRRELWIALIDI